MTPTEENTAAGEAIKQWEKLFNRLYRTDASRQRPDAGAGLGLSMCKNIVEAHQGEVQAASSELGGLCLRITLPL